LVGTPSPALNTHPDRVALAISDAKGTRAHAFPLEADHQYALSARVDSEQAVEKAVLLKVEFRGAASTIPPRGFSHSAKYGFFCYLNTGENRVSFVAPAGATELEVQIVPWALRAGNVSIGRHLTLLRLADAVVSRIVRAEVESIVGTASRSDLSVIIYTGTKRIGEGGRANRSMMFARELERMAIPTVYTYVPSDGGLDLARDSDFLLQVPIGQVEAVASDIASGMKSRQRVLIGSMPDERFCRLAGQFRFHGWRVVYECRDEWAEFAAVGAANWYSEVFERFAVEQAEKVFCVSPALVEKMQRFTARPEKVLLSPNGTTDHFIASGRALRRSRHDLLPATAGQPVIGYFGHLTEQWFDWGAVTAAAARLPDLRFELIGFDMPSISLPPNVDFLGSKSHDEILQIARHWSVALIPFKHGKLSRAADPIKIYEYLSLGLKVAACPMGTIDRFPLTFCYEEFGLVDAIEAALRYKPTDADMKAVDGILDSASWNARLRDLLSRTGVSLDAADPPRADGLSIAEVAGGG
jgi:hypothetical protein